MAINYHPAAIHSHIIQAWVKNGERWQLVAQQGVTVGEGEVTPATQRSAVLPASSGPQLERDAVQKNMDSIDEAIRKGDPTMWGNAVSDQFIETARQGDFRSKKERMAEIAAVGPQPIAFTGILRSSIGG